MEIAKEDFTNFFKKYIVIKFKKIKKLYNLLYILD
jgi:hypothetical protein